MILHYVGNRHYVREHKHFLILYCTLNLRGAIIAFHSAESQFFLILGSMLVRLQCRGLGGGEKHGTRASLKVGCMHTSYI